MDRAALPEPMRRDVRLLGDILGEVIRDSGGPELLAAVEHLRRAVIEARRGERVAYPARGAPGVACGADPAGDEIAALVGSWSLEQAEQVARAFTVYFHLANLAEEHQRIRILRERDSGEAPVPESLAAAVAELRQDTDPGRLRELLVSLRVHLVLTAHPTEARRRAVVEALRRLSGLLDALNDPRAAAADRAEARRGLREQVDLLWRTSQLRVKAMDPIDEVRAVMTAFDETLFRVVPAVYRELDRALDPGGGPAAPVPAFVRFGSWVGADRDGNPLVTGQVTRETATIQADHVLRALENATTRIGRALTLHEATTPPSAALRRALAAASAAHPELLAELAARSPQEPYRVYLLYAAQRLAATRVRHADLAYRGPAEFLAGLRVVQESLAAAGAAEQARGELQQLIWQAETFGFHLAGLEVRQHSEVHARALAELRAAGPPGLEDDVPPHGDPLSGRAAGAPSWSPQTEEVLAAFRAVAWIQDRFGTGACRRYVVSFTRSAQDIAAVYELARYAMPGGPVPELDVVPLFESAADLAHAPDVMTGMLALPDVAERVAANGGALEAMLGYSDSAKELGPASATLRLFDAQARLAGWAADHGIRLTLFHGRGGALGRGGGPAGRAVLAQAPGSVNGSFKVTEQGEVIFARYGQRPIAKRHLEQVSSAVLLASSPRIAERNAAAAAAYSQVAGRIDEAARAAFRRLVDADGFAGWFARISPLGEIGRLRIGSRPARRGLVSADRPGAPAATDLADLRAIPWVFAWSQTRLNLPGWYGLGSGLAAVADAEGPEVLRRAYREWPLFGVLLDNAEMSLAKTDRLIGTRYLALGGRDDLTRLVLAEYDLTKRLVLTVIGHDRLLAEREVLSRAVSLRDPYIDALSYLQLRALAALRAESRATPPEADPAALREADPAALREADPAALREADPAAWREADRAAWRAAPQARPDRAAPDAERDRLERLLLLTVNGVAAGLQNTG